MAETHEKSVNGEVVQRMVMDYQSKTVEKWEFVDDVWTKTVERAMTAEEITDRNAEESERALDTRLRAVQKKNQAFLDLASPTNNQAMAQLKSLTRQMDALLRQQAKDLKV